MGSKEQLAELVSNLPEWQAGHLLGVAQAYLAAVREAEEKGRTDISGEVVNFLKANTALVKAEAPRTEAPPIAAVQAAAPQAEETPQAETPKPAETPRAAVWQAASYDRTAQGPNAGNVGNVGNSAGRVIYSNPPAGSEEGK